MRFTAAVSAFLGFAVFVSAQNSTSSAATSTASLSPQQRCLASCGSADICCQAACVNVPCPSDLQANATTTCAAQCPQGNGTAEETSQYAACQSACISSHFFSSGTVVPTQSGSPSATTTGTGRTTATGSTSQSGSHTGSSTASSTASQTANSAPEVRFGAAGAGLLGLIVAGLAL